jgi:phenylpropionate dioxygenase-like ring-hydroxylating dioxygenase large terminal subunit
MRSELRRIGINPHHWYALAPISAFTPERLLRATLWGEDIVLFRDPRGTFYALEDRCPHRQVRLSHGKVRGDSIECAYHGWRINVAGGCEAVPYLKDDQPLPLCSIRTYPVRAQDGFVWVFPGDSDLADQTPILSIPEFNHLNFITSITTIDVKAHFSFLIENLMDMHHGHLHAHYQAWSDASLVRVALDEGRVDAHYRAITHLKVKSIFSWAQIFLPPLRRASQEKLSVSYIYPHWTSRLGEDFRLYGLICPCGPRHTRAFLIHFASLESFHHLQLFPMALRRWIKHRFRNSTKFLLDRLIEQDIVMLEEEQCAFDRDPRRLPVELNPSLIAVQRLIRSQGTVGPAVGGSSAPAVDVLRNAVPSPTQPEARDGTCGIG